MIDVDRHGPVWRLTLNRPDKANALNREMLVQALDVARAARATPPRALILTGTGRIFSAGADLDAARAGLATDRVWEDLSSALAALPCLTIAALNGTVAGGAFGMVLACDLRIAVPEARFFYPVMKLGFLPQPSDPGRLRALVGPARAKLILMAGAKIGVEQALAFGLVDEIVGAGALIGRAEALAADAVTATPEHVAAIKGMIDDV